MSADDERIATEKLLEVIRGKKESHDDDAPKESRPIPAFEIDPGYDAESPTKDFSESLPEARLHTLSRDGTLRETDEVIKKPSRIRTMTPRKRSWQLFRIGPKKAVLGLDIGFHSIKYVLLNQTADGPVLRDFGMKMLPPLSEDVLSRNEDMFMETVRQLVKERGILANRVVAAVSGPQVAFRRMPIPKIPSRELRQSIFWAVRKEIPFSLDDTLFDYHIMAEVVDQDVKKLDTLVVAAETSLIDSIYQIIKRAGLRLDAITSIPMALWNLQRAISMSSGQQPAVFLDIGYRTTTFTFFDAGKLTFTREVFTAGQSLAPLAEGLPHTEETPPGGQESRLPGEKMRESDVLPPIMGDAGVDGMTATRTLDKDSPALGRLINEINRSMDYYQSCYPDAPLEPMYISGGVSCMQGFDKLLSQRLCLEVRRLNPFSCLRPGTQFLEADLSESVFPLYGIAVGLALDDGRGINLLPKEQRTRTEIALDHFVLPAGAATASIALLMAALFGYYTAMSEKTQKTLSELQAGHQNLTRLEMAEARLLADQESQLDVTRRIVSYINYRASRAPAIMKELSRITPAEISLDTAIIDKKNNNALPGTSSSPDNNNLFLELKGSVFGIPSLQGAVLTKFMLALNESPFFSFPRIISQSREDGSGEARLNFNLECRMKLELR
ncbi:MAG: type IV pilus assembly protein PilM [Deltaproteobacteria bacterium]|nr:type IV pilus assembly protein PilM [Deltaproteobacteria bacterium]MBW2305777.1 type IV pilus assembly protein PilM [Deltaproteobacteria bacterium]